MTQNQKIILNNNLEVLKQSRQKTISDFLEKNVFLYNNILHSEESKTLKSYCLERVRLEWISAILEIFLSLNEEFDCENLRKENEKSFQHIFNYKILKIYNSVNSISTSDIYKELIDSSSSILDSFINVGIGSEEKLSRFKLEIKLSNKKFDNIIKKLKQKEDGDS